MTATNPRRKWTKDEERRSGTIREEIRAVTDYLPVAAVFHDGLDGMGMMVGRKGFVWWQLQHSQTLHQVDGARVKIKTQIEGALVHADRQGTGRH